MKKKPSKQSQKPKSSVKVLDIKPGRNPKGGKRKSPGPLDPTT